MKRFIFVTLAAAFIISHANAQHSISGKVTDAFTGKELPGAGIAIANTLFTTLAGPGGIYSLTGMKPGRYILLVTHLGYETDTVIISVPETGVADVQLTPRAILSEEVVISASRAGKTTPATYTTIDRMEIVRKNDVADLPYMIANTPSMVVSSDAGAGVGYTGLRIRGSDITRINVTLNGIPLNDAESQGVFWVNMPDFASSVDNIQVQRGVGTSANGTASFGGSINIQTLKLNAAPYAETNHSAGSYNTWKNNLLFGTGLIGGKWAIDGRLSHISTDGYIDRASSKLKSAYLSAGYFGERSITKFIFMTGSEKTYQAWMGVPKDSLKSNPTFNPFTYENQTDNYTQSHYQLFWSWKAASTLMLNTAAHYTGGKGYYEEYQDENDPAAATSFSSYGLADLIRESDTITLSSLVRQQWLDNDFAGLTINASWDISPVMNLTGGVAGSTYTGDHFGDIVWARVSETVPLNYRWYNNKGNKTEGNAFGRFNWNIGKYFNVFTDLQYRWVTHDMRGIDAFLRDIGQSHTFSFFNPKAGAGFYDGKSNRAYISFGISNREPNRNNFADANPAGPAPLPERLYNAEASYSYIAKKIEATACLYYMFYTDQLVLTGEINDVGYPVMANVPESYRTGIEISVKTIPFRFLEWQFTSTLSRNRIKAFTEYIDDWDTWAQLSNELGETDIAFSPALTAFSGFRFTVYKGMSLTFDSRYCSRQYIDNTSSEARSLDPFLVNDAGLAFSFKPGFVNEISFSVKAANVFDHAYETNAWVYRYISGGKEYSSDGYFPQAGRHFTGSIRLLF